MRGLLLALLLSFCSVARAGEPVDYLVSTVTSYHFDRHRDYNERNFGLGWERRYSDEWAGSLGYYRNSYDRLTVYTFASYTPWTVATWRMGVVFGVVTGYDEDRPSTWLTGVATRDFGGLGLNVVFAPAALAFQVKWRIR